MTGPRASDPLGVLRSPDTPIDPSAAFAADLRARLVRALATGDTPMTTTAVSAPNGLRHGDISYVSISVPDAARGIAFYGAVLGWNGEPTGHGTQISDTVPMVGLGQGFAEPGVHLAYRVDDVAAAVEAVRTHGGAAQDPVDRGYALEAEVRDPAGLLLWLHQFPSGEETAVVQGFPPGGISYVSLLVPDGEAARGFYSAVLGWTYDDGNPVGTTPFMGIGSGPRDAYGAVPSYTVTDLAASVATVRAAGGTATDPVQRPYALSAECVDDQGMPFYLHQY